MSWGRSVGAVLAGFFATAVLSVGTDAVLHATGVYPPMGVRMSDGLFVLAGVYRAVYTVVGGWVAARLAPHAPMRHAWALATLGTLAGLGGVVVAWNGGDALGPMWYAVSIPLSAFPCIGAGAWLRTRQVGGEAVRSA